MELNIAVKEAIHNNKDKIQEYTNSKSDAPINYLIGIVLQKTGGEHNYVEVENEFKNQLSDLKTNIEYPRELVLYHRAGQTVIAEKISNELRDELDVPIESVHIPDRFNVPEVKLKYNIHKNGDVEFVEANE
jgi:hypothetical protein